MRSTFAEINLSNLKYNFLNIRKKIGNRKIMAVVKADAYGHGMIRCVEKFEKLGSKKPEYYGVALTEEGIELRKAKITDQPIVTFSPIKVDELNDYLRHKIYPSFCSESDFGKLKKYKSGKQLRIHINIDTGMGRLGIPHKKAVEIISRISKIKNVKIDGIYTHFATSDEKDKTFANLQLERFNEILKQLRYEKVDFGIVHAANSGAILDMPQAYFDMVRPGISLYGYYPSLETSESIKLKPVMSLYSSVSTFKQISKGDSVSYGRRFIANRKTNVATLPIGYADGISRNLTNRMSIIIKNKVYPQIGTVTMDRICVNTGNDKIKLGSKAILLGKSNNYKIDAWDWSKILNTIPYEITCNISKRVPRVYKG